MKSYHKLEIEKKMYLYYNILRSKLVKKGHRYEKEFLFLELKKKKKKKKLWKKKRRSKVLLPLLGLDNKTRLFYSSISYGNKECNMKATAIKIKRQKAQKRLIVVLETYGSQSNLIQSERKSQANASKIPSYLQREILLQRMLKKREYNVDLPHEGEVVEQLIAHFFLKMRPRKIQNQSQIY